MRAFIVAVVFVIACSSSSERPDTDLSSSTDLASAADISVSEGEDLAEADLTTMDVVAPLVATITASPNQVFADGVAAATITVTVRDSGGTAAPNIAVLLTQLSTLDRFAASSGTTDASGVFSTTLVSRIPGNKTITANVETVAVQSSPITFVAPPWEPANGSMSGGSAYRIAIPSADSPASQSGWAYLCTGETLFKTENGGASWTASNFGLETANPINIAVAPGDARIAFAVSDHDALFKTDDGGLSWYGLPTPFLSYRPPAFYRSPAGAITMYVLGNSGEVFRSSDLGINWQSTGPSVGSTTLGLAVDRNTGMLYVLDSSSGISTYDGSTWTNLGNTGFPGGGFSSSRQLGAE
jgi:hypothetical protein